MASILAHQGSFSFNGHLTLTTVDTEWFQAHRHNTALMLNPPDNVINDQLSGDNTMCTAGLSVLVGAISWSGIQDQAANLGVTTPTYLTPLYGAVGTGTGTTASTDTQLFSELSRETVGAGASSPATATISAQATWLFYFPAPSVTWSITEAGVFCNASSSTNSGSLLDHFVFGATITVPTTNTLILQTSFAIAGM
jgi:hypothetical protein